MDLKYYPLDKQTCSITMVSYGYTTEDLVFLWKKDEPVQLVKTLHLPRFTLEAFLTDYCSSRTNTGIDLYALQVYDFIYKEMASRDLMDGGSRIRNSITLKTLLCSNEAGVGYIFNSCVET
ncbi:glutamate-gated chloride channel [Nephila pilipes]|uniref:Glutamate-gated chloride channel n=1 Tax=Nephila pilipes TaxID=299642 RepID=A0A8X6P7A2_NEPPI|nr:glutamate-gated chloride channel [Nephila pilipes]